MLLLFATIGLVIIIVLAFIAWRLRRQVRVMEHQQTERRAEHQRQQHAHQHYLNNSVQVLAQSMLADQVSLTEGAIRISVLLDNLGVNGTERTPFEPFFQLAERTAHIPILDKWKALSKKEKAHFEKERSRIEDEYREPVRQAAQVIQGKVFY